MSNIMKFESVLPPDFDGTFRFSNPDKEDFIGTWAKREYLFPAKSMTPIIIPEHSPLEIQHIRKHFAKQWAEKQFFKSKGYKTLEGQEGKPGNRNFNSIHQAGQYTIKDLEPYIKMCLIPLDEAKLTARPMNVRKVEDNLSRGDDGEIQTEAIAGGQNWQNSKVSLKKKALES
jgi:hypothetical protein